MRQVAGDDVIHRTLNTAIQCGYRLIGELREDGVENNSRDSVVMRALA